MSKAAGWFLVFALGFSASAVADVSPGRKPPRPPVEPPPRTAPGNLEMIIRIDPAAKDARLELPAKLLPRQAAGAGAGAAGDATSGTISAPRTVAAGIALSVAMASLLLIRRRRTAVFAGAGAACVAALFGASLVSANVGPPPQRPEPAPAAASEPLTAASIVRELGNALGRNVAGQVRVEVSNTANVITLVLPKGTSKETPAQPASAPKSAAPKSAPPPSDR